MVTIGSCHSDSAPAASSTPAPTTAVAVKKPTMRSRSGLGHHQGDQRPRGDAGRGQHHLRRTELPGTANASAAAIGHQRGDRQRRPGAFGERAVMNKPASAVTAAIAPTATSPASAPVATR